MPLSLTGLVTGINRGLAGWGRGRGAGEQAAYERQQAEAEARRRALMDELQASLAERRLGAQEEQFKAEAPMREALAQQRLALAQKSLRPSAPGTRLIRTAEGQEIVKDVPGQTFAPPPRGGGGGGGMGAEQRLYQQIQQEARQRVARHDARVRTDRTYRRAVQTGALPARDEDSEFNAVVNLRFRRGELTNAQRDRLLGSRQSEPVSPYGPRP